MDEVTTAKDPRRALEKDLKMEGVEMSITLGFNQTQAANIRVPVAASNKTLEIGTVKVGWTGCALRLPVQDIRCSK